MPLATFLLSMAASLVGRVLTALGMSVVTITGFDLVIGELKSSLTSSASSLPADALNLFLLAGGGSGVGIIFGAINVRVALWMIQRASKIVGTPGS